jgi:hypothetical protein
LRKVAAPAVADGPPDGEEPEHAQQHYHGQGDQQITQQVRGTRPLWRFVPRWSRAARR